MTTVTCVAHVDSGLKIVVKESNQDLPKETWKTTTHCIRGRGERSNKVSHMRINCFSVQGVSLSSIVHGSVSEVIGDSMNLYVVLLSS